METSALEYELPPELIAQRPVERRDESRLLVYERASGDVRHRRFSELAEELSPDELVVVNETRVIPARLRLRRPGGGEAEVLLLEHVGPDGIWEGLARPSRRLRPGQRLGPVELLESLGEGRWRLRLEGEPAGEAPLPPYITQTLDDPERYQTVYARPPGSAAAPTAGLHFTPALLASLEAAGIRRGSVTLHVGLDTFRPLEGEYVDEHQIHREWYEIPPSTRVAIDDTKRNAGRVVAVGTTAVRVLETAARAQQASGWTDLYITPPYAFRAVDTLITNFHLPRSSLLLLVTAFVQAGMPGSAPLEARDTLLAAYAAALAEGYRFFSFGDAMLIG